MWELDLDWHINEFCYFVSNFLQFFFIHSQKMSESGRRSVTATYNNIYLYTLRCKGREFRFRVVNIWTSANNTIAESWNENKKLFHLDLCSFSVSIHERMLVIEIAQYPCENIHFFCLFVYSIRVHGRQFNWCSCFLQGKQMMIYLS